ncbi:hypothetical protein J26TS2_01070 [Shouchella clausii]|nr:hypothetical protein J26TS2_01070 [Shouchella clausii]
MKSSLYALISFDGSVSIIERNSLSEAKECASVSLGRELLPSEKVIILKGKTKRLKTLKQNLGFIEDAQIFNDVLDLLDDEDCPDWYIRKKERELREAMELFNQMRSRKHNRFAKLVLRKKSYEACRYLNKITAELEEEVIDLVRSSSC